MPSCVKLFILGLILSLPLASISQDLPFDGSLIEPSSALQTTVSDIKSGDYMEAIKTLSPIVSTKDSSLYTDALYLRGYCFYKLDRINLACVDWKYYLLNDSSQTILQDFCTHYNDSIQEVKNRYYPPEFPGGKDSLAYLLSFISYPLDEMADKKSGEGKLKVFINEDGSIKQVTLIEGSESFGLPLISAFNYLPNYIPAKYLNGNIDTSFIFTFRFHLESTYSKLSMEEAEQYDYCNVQYWRYGIDMADDAQVKKDRTSNDYYGIGLIELKEENYSVALINFDKCLSMKYTDIDALTNRGITHFYLGDMQKACIDWRHAAIGGDEQAQELFNLKCRE